MRKIIKVITLTFFIVGGMSVAGYVYYSRLYPYGYTHSPRVIMRTANNKLFPDIDHSDKHFGILKFRNANTVSIFVSYLFSKSLSNQPVNVPTHIVYGAEDHLLGLNDQDSRRHYETGFSGLIESLSFSQVEVGNHFFEWSYQAVNQKIRTFFESL